MSWLGMASGMAYTAGSTKCNMHACSEMHVNGSFAAQTAPLCCGILCKQESSATIRMQVPVDPRDAAIVQAIADGDAAVQRVFQARLQASLHRSSRRFEDLQPAEEDCGR